MVNVIFREIEESGIVVAIFPSFIVTNDRVLSMVNGRFDSIRKDFCLNHTIPTKDFFDSLNELLLKGYHEIKIIERFSNGS